MGPKYIVINADSGLAVNPTHPYNDTAAPSRTFDTPEQAEAFAVVIGGGMPRCTPGHEDEPKHQVREA
jgi:hypothetical protein